jgi:hypothetical protein
VVKKYCLVRLGAELWILITGFNIIAIYSKFGYKKFGGQCPPNRDI